MALGAGASHESRLNVEDMSFENAIIRRKIAKRTTDEIAYVEP